MGVRRLYYGADRVPRERLETSPSYRQLSRGTFLCIVEVGMRPCDTKHSIFQPETTCLTRRIVVNTKEKLKLFLHFSCLSLYQVIVQINARMWTFSICSAADELLTQSNIRHSSVISCMVHYNLHRKVRYPCFKLNTPSTLFLLSLLIYM